MSSEGDKAKNTSLEVDDKSENDSIDSSPSKDEKASDVVKDENKQEEKNDKSSDEKNNKQPEEKDGKAEDSSKTEVEDKADKTPKKEEKKNDPEENGSEKNEESEEEDEEEEDKKETVKDRKKNQKSDDVESNENSKTEIPNGSGTQLGEIPRIDASISRFKNDDLKLLHQVLFKNSGKTMMIKKNIRRFNGFDFKLDSDDFSKKSAAIQKFEVKQLKSICEMLDLQKTGSKDDIVQRIMEFLIEPKDSGKTVSGGRPKRTAAVRANNRGYSSHDDSYSSDERHSTRARRDKGKRSNLKDESSSGSDEEFHPSDASDEKPRVKPRRSRKKAQSEDDSDINESGSSEESDDEPKNRRKRASNKVANNKAKGKRGRRGRKPAAKKPPQKRGSKRKESSEEEEDESDHKEEDEGNTSEDEPLAKKTKAAQPPTDEEIKTYVKEILDGANLEEITMKTVCKQVYAHYPDFDLAHKKDFIKTTVKSLIST